MRYDALENRLRLGTYSSGNLAHSSLKLALSTEQVVLSLYDLAGLCSEVQTVSSLSPARDSFEIKAGEAPLLALARAFLLPVVPGCSSCIMLPQADQKLGPLEAQ